MKRIVLDTDVASQVFKQTLPDDIAAQLAGHEPCLTFVTVGELIKWTEIRRWSGRSRRALTRWIDDLAVLPSSDDVSSLWGELSAAAQRRGRRQEANDTWIAACCVAGRLPLATRNIKDCMDFAEHDGLVLVGE